MIGVLVVDDDFMVARVHTGFVERVPGFAVVGTAHTGSDALEAIAALRPDLVLLDIYLPDISGLEVLRRLREQQSPVDVLVVTAARDVDTVRGALRGGAVHYVVKPFSFDTLRDGLERYAAAWQRLSAAGSPAQADVDRLFGTLRPGEVDAAQGPQPGHRGADRHRAALQRDRPVGGRMRRAGRAVPGEHPALPGAPGRARARPRCGRGTAGHGPARAPLPLDHG